MLPEDFPSSVMTTNLAHTLSPGDTIVMNGSYCVVSETRSAHEFKVRDLYWHEQIRLWFTAKWCDLRLCWTCKAEPWLLKNRVGGCGR